MSESLIPNLGDSNKMAAALLKQMPEATRKAAITCWSMQRHLQGMESALPLVSMLSHWISVDFTAADAVEVLNGLCLPERMAAHKFPSDFVTDFAELVSRQKAKRRALTDTAARRGQDIDPEEQAKVKDLIADFARSL